MCIVNNENNHARRVILPDECFDVKAGLVVQRTHLSFYKRHLKEGSYMKLERIIKGMTSTKQLNSGFDVPRGEQIKGVFMNLDLY